MSSSQTPPPESPILSPLPQQKPPPIPIAICGMALHLPGNINSPSTFFQALLTGLDARTPIPASRFNSPGFSTSKNGSPNITHGYFLPDSALTTLDTSFFTCHKSELDNMDPQHRQLLQVTRECLESAGETSQTYRGKNIGCYIGTFGDDWLLLQSKENLQGNNGMMNMDLLLANRISYEYDFRGPSMVIKTGCSASLVAVHEACRGLQAGDIDGALVGGVNLILSPEMYSTMRFAGVVSADGSCKVFDAAADGYGRAEAVNAVYLKRLDDAVRDGNPIRGVIRGSGTRANGRGGDGLFAPDSNGQAELIRSVYENVGVDPGETGYIECHGTGTVQGDRKEAGAVAEVFGKKGGIFMGSVKANFGHSEGASGITSLIKAILTLEKRTIPPQIKFECPNPDIPFEEKRLVVPVEVTAWPEDRKERISVNSFGIGGSNAHVIVESLASYNPGMAQKTGEGPNTDPALLLLSANTPNSLQKLVDNTLEYSGKNPESLQDLSYTLTMRRDHLIHRSFVVKDRHGRADLIPPVKCNEHPPKLVMVFSGQGAQWPQMGIKLMNFDPDFKNDLLAMDAALQRLQNPPSWSILEEFSKDPDSSRVYQASWSQPLCTALQVALVRSFARKDIFPDAVIGHSSGEIAAAFAAGALTKEEAIVIAYYRGFVMSRKSRKGAMAAIGLGSTDVTPFLLPGTVIAAENSPTSSTISGDIESIQSVMVEIKKLRPEVLCKQLAVDTAYHHPEHMSEPSVAYLEYLPDELPNRHCAPTLPMYSTVLGDKLNTSIDLGYWVTNLTSPVKFSSAATKLITNLPNSFFLEIGPHSQLKGPLRQITTQAKVPLNYTSALLRKEDASFTFLTALGHLWQQGFSPAFSSFISGKTLSDLPPYPWDHSSHHWSEGRVTKSWKYRQHPHHALLGQRIPETPELSPAWRCVLKLEDEPWLAGHKVKGDIIFPFAGYISIAGEAIRQLSGIESGYRVRNVVAHTALLLHQTKPTEIITSLRPQRLTDSKDSEYHHFSIVSYTGSSWIKHCEGLVKSLSEPITTSLPVETNPLPRKVSSSRLYTSFNRIGIQFGPSFRRLEHLSTSTTSNQAICSILPPENDFHEYQLHPTAIDACLQLSLIATIKGQGKLLQSLSIPSFIKEIDILSSQPTSAHAFNNLVEATDSDGNTTFKLSGLKLSRLDNPDSPSDRHAAAKMIWHPHLSFLDHSTLITSPPTSIPTWKLLEELTLLLIIDSEAKTHHITPPTTHLHFFKLWLQKTVSDAKEGRYPVLDPTTLTSILSIPPENRPIEINSRYKLALDISSDFKAMPQLLLKIHSNILPLFTGQTDAVQLLMSDDNNLLTDLYRTITFDVSSFVQSLSITKPGLQILEVGAGTGGTTAKILEKFSSPKTTRPSYAKYTFTDISSGFFPKAQQKFNSAPNIEYLVFDASQSPLTQGFTPKSYDLIIATNVIHALPSLHEALSNVKTLLRPGGHLLLVELCAAELRSAGFIFGTFPGWWLGRDKDSREWSPHVSIERWGTELKNAGFTGADTVVLDLPEPYSCVAAIVSQVPTVKSLESSRGHHHHISILHQNPEAKVTKSLVENLESQGHMVTMIKLGDHPPLDSIVISTLDYESPLFDNISSDNLSKFQDLCRNYNSKELLWLKPPTKIECVDLRTAQSDAVLGIFRKENNLPFFTLGIKADEPGFTDLVLQVQKEIISQDDDRRVEADREFLVDRGIVKVSRLEPISLEKPSSQAFTAENTAKALSLGQVGSLSSLYWQTQEVREPGDSEVVVEIMAVGLNFVDLLGLLGMIELSDKLAFGLEVSGIVSKVGSGVRHLNVGDRVAAAIPDGCFSTRAVVDTLLCVKIPDTIGFEDAAAILVTYSTAMYSLIDVAQTKAGQTVLIHSGCGGVGLAAIQICKMIGAEVYITVGTQKKIDYAVQVLGIPRHHIFSSRNETFVQDVARMTNGRGVDVVLNSLSGMLLHSSWECLAEFGKMIEIGKMDIIGRGSLDMEPFLLNRSFCCVDLRQLLRKRPEETQRILLRVFDDISQGNLRIPEPPTVFDAVDAAAAYRWLQRGDHIGKAVVKFGDKSAIPAVPIAAQPVSFSPDATYLITGGLGGLGRSTATWMAERGARSLIFLSRSAGQTSSDQDFLLELNTMGCHGIAVAGRVENADDVKEAICQAPSPIRGVVHLAMVQREGAGVGLGHDDWQSVVRPKVDGAWNLHNCLSDMPLDFFVMTSSILTLSHQAGGSNYGAANGFLESFAEYRRGLGLPASTIVVTALSEVGFVEENPAAMRKLRSGGYTILAEKEFLDFLDYSIRHQLPDSTETSPIASCSSGGYVAMGIDSETPFSDPSCRAVWRRDPRLGSLHNIGYEAKTGAQGAKETSPASDLLSRARLEPNILESKEASKVFGVEIGRRVRTMMMMSNQDSEINLGLTLKQMGVDSLIAVELRQWWKLVFGIEMTTLEIMGGGSLEDLGGITAGKVLERWGSNST
ncbi:putative polyketide synthase [Podospora fimiseda]|uniref:Polyketide synthase n=1 Tax=Podospora fimiseda TaxID=252190 RepID=A0AAN7H3G5_9PEZI|nr:putative polyketide synthase [Podospora fimiseda]